ncbi:Uncharacterised protein [uncultured archaeon]|nr:Uncharacterised protein [uncultured archaeon]
MDAGGNSGSATASVSNIDRTAPVITLNGSASVTVEAGSTYTDAGASASDNYDSSVTVVPNGYVNTSALGDYNLTYTAADTAGNSAEPQVRTVHLVDLTSPVITINGSNPLNVEAGSAYIDDGASATDNYDDNVNVSSSGSVDTSTLGEYNLTYTAIDSSNNTATAVRTVHVVDTSAPSTSVILNGTSGLAGWYNSSVTVILNASSGAGSNLSFTRYTLDGGSVTNYAGPFTLSADGIHNLTYYSGDEAGNTETQQARSIQIDASAPSTAFSPSGSSGLNGWYVSNVSVSLVPSDNTSGTDFTTYQIDGGAPANGTSFILSAEGTHTVSYYSTDSAGNAEPAKTQTLQIDKTAPTASVSYNATSATNGDVLATLAPSENVTITNNGGNSTYLFTTNGEFTFQFQDAAGNSGSAAAAVSTIDKTAPALTLLSPAPNTNFYSSSVGVDFTAYDGGSGINTSSCYYTLAGADTALPGCSAASLTLSDGVKILTLHASDLAGNRQSAQVTFLVDTTSTNSVLVNDTTVTDATNQQVVIASTSPNATLSLNASSTSATLNASEVLNTSTSSADLPSSLNISVNSSMGVFNVQIPATTVTGTPGWDGTFSLPVVSTNASAQPTDAGTNTVSAVVEIGVSGVRLNFTNAVRLILPGQAGKLAGFVVGSTFTPITTTCTEDSQSWADTGHAAGAECKMTSRSDLIIWTKQITQ